MAPTPEKKVQNAVLLYLKNHTDAWCWRNNTGMTKIGGRTMSFGQRGSADIIGILPDGRFLAIECKSAKGRLSKAQKAWGWKVEDQGGVYIVAKSVWDVYDALTHTNVYDVYGVDDFHRADEPRGRRPEDGA